MKRWPVIRHVRWFYLSWQAHRWAQQWGRMGVGLGQPNSSDLRYLDDVWAGRK